MQFIRLVQRMPDNAYMSQVTEFDDDDESDDDMGRQDGEIPKILEPRKREPKGMMIQSPLLGGRSRRHWIVWPHVRAFADTKTINFACI